MGKFRLTIKTNFGEISVEGDSPTDLRNTLLSMGISEESINNVLEIVKQKLETRILPSPVSVAPSKPEQAGVIEYTSDGTPHIAVSTDDLSAKEVIGLLLYAKGPNPTSMNELTKLVRDNWKGIEITTVSANLSQMKAYVIKEGTRGSYSYKLSGSGKNWVENELLPKLKMKTKMT